MSTLLLLVGLVLHPDAAAATGEASFSPSSVRVPIYRLSLRNSSTGVESSVYTCSASSDAGCVHDLTDEADLASIGSAATAPAVGTYDQLVVQYCRSGSGYDAEVSGSVEIGSTRYYTAGNTTVLSTTAGDQAPVSVPYSGCATRYGLLQPVEAEEGETVHLRLLVFNRFSAWMKLGPKSLPSGCRENAGQTRSLCASYPDLIPVASTSGSIDPAIEAYGLDGQSSGGPDALSGLVLLVVDRSSGDLIAGMTRRYFSATSVPVATGFDTALKRISRNLTGTYQLENYGSTESGPGYLRFPAFERGADHTGTLTTEGGATVPYRSFFVGDGDGDGGSGGGCTSIPSPTFTHMVTDLSMHRAITPMGTVATGGETKNRHQMQTVVNFSAGTYSGTMAPVYSPIATRVLAIRKQETTTPFVDTYYGVMLEVSCEVTIQVDHVRVASPKLAAAVAGLSFPVGATFQAPAVPTEFAAGELIGQTDGTPPSTEQLAFAWDFLVLDSNHTNTFVNQSRYTGGGTYASFLHARCAGDFYTGGLQTAFAAKLGYGSFSAAGDCRSASRDVAGALAGMWYRVGAAENSTGFRLAIATEVTGEVRLNIHPFNQFFFSPIQGSGLKNRDPAVASGTTGYCYSDGTDERWMKLRSGGLLMDATPPVSGTCAGSEPASGAFTEHWER